jgi:large subunit ribosomal protein L25
VQFHPVTDVAMHFDLYRVEADQLISIGVPVTFRNHDLSPGLKRGGTLNVNLHEVELMVPADKIPEEIVIDLTGLEIGDSVRASELSLPPGAELSARLSEATVASIATSSSMAEEEEEAAAGEVEGEGEATEEEAE